MAIRLFLGPQVAFASHSVDKSLSFQQGISWDMLHKTRADSWVLSRCCCLLCCKVYTEADSRADSCVPLGGRMMKLQIPFSYKKDDWFVNQFRWITRSKSYSLQVTLSDRNLFIRYSVSVSLRHINHVCFILLDMQFAVFRIWMSKYLTTLPYDSNRNKIKTPTFKMQLK